MKSIEELLRNLARPEVLEFGLVTNRLPSVNIGGKFEPVDDEAPTTRKLLDMLSAVGGATHVPALSEKPIQWTYRMDGVGIVAIAAIMRKDVVQARFTLAKRDPRIAVSPSGPPPRAAAPQAQPAAPPAAPVPTAATPAQRQQPPRASAPPFRTGPQGAPTSAPAPPPTSSIQRAAPAPQEEEEEEGDDDQPTVQMASPPVKGRPGQLAKEEGPAPPPRPREAPPQPPAPPPLSLDPEPPPPVASQAAAPASAPAQRGPFRILTPTSVDMVDIEEATKTAQAKREGPSQEDPVDGQARTASIPAPPVTAPLPAAPPKPDEAKPRVAGLDDILVLAAPRDGVRPSDLHVLAGRPVLVRLASDLLARTQAVAPETVEGIVKEIVPPRLRATFASEGSCDFALDHPQHGRFRVNVSRQRTGEKISLRVLPREVPTLASLGLPDSLASTARLLQGLVLVVGPVGHGKSSTVAAIVDHLNRETTHHVLTVEDPIEIVHPRKRAVVSQREIGTHVRSVDAALAAAAHEDVDVVVVGELRDSASIRAALAAAESGRLVLATSSERTSAKAIERLVDAFPPDEVARARVRVGTALRAVICQRLVPSADRSRLHAAVELLPMSLALFALVRDGKTDQIPALQRQARGGPMIRLDEALAELVRTQKVTAEVAKQFAESPVELDAIVARGAPVARKG